MKLSREDLARRFAQADRMVVLLRRATLDMRAAGDFVFAQRRRARSAERGDPGPTLPRDPSATGRQWT